MEVQKHACVPSPSFLIGGPLRKSILLWALLLWQAPFEFLKLLMLNRFSQTSFYFHLQWLLSLKTSYTLVLNQVLSKKYYQIMFYVDFLYFWRILCLEVPNCNYLVELIPALLETGSVEEEAFIRKLSFYKVRLATTL